MGGLFPNLVGDKHLLIYEPDSPISIFSRSWGIHGVTDGSCPVACPGPGEESLWAQLRPPGRGASGGGRGSSTCLPAVPLRLYSWRFY